MKAAQVLDQLFEVKPGLKPLLVIVHPGSLCGSYHSSHMFDEENLNKLVSEIHDWDGDCAIIHGELSDEIIDYRKIRDAIDAVVWSGAEEYEGNLSFAAKGIARDFSVKNRPFVFVTGAWADPNNGCASYVAAQLQKAGAKVKLSKYSPTFS